MLSNEALEAYSEEYYKDIFRYCLSKLKNNEDAWDATQETFLFFKERSFDLMDINIKAWLKWVAHYRIQEIYAQRMKDRKFFSEYSEEIIPMDKHMEAIEAQIVDCNIGKYANLIYAFLSDSDKDLFYMLYVEGLSEKLIAEKLNLEPHALYMRVSRLRKRMSKFIRDELLY